VSRRTNAPPLAIYMNGEYVGLWQLTPRGEEFQYADTWIASATSRPISLKFPLTPERKPYVGAEVRDYFENLLPDTKAIRERMARRFRIGSTDAYCLLAKLGRDCVGALQIVPANEAPPNVQKISCRALTNADIAAHLRLATEPSSGAFYDGEADEDFRISLAGAQEKTALLFHKGAWHKPLAATPTTHILKLPLGRVGNMQLNMDSSVENEWLCSKIIAQFGLPIAPTEIATFEDQKVLVVERFDRRLSVDKKWIMRLPQEDMCQATGTSYLQKYQADGGPGIDRIMDLLRNSKNAFVDRQVFFACQVVFWLLAATDGHAKNFSIRIDAGGEYALTPIYDVVSVYPLLGPKAGQLAIQKAGLAMGVRGDKNMHYRLREIMRRHWNTTARRNGLLDGGEQIINEIIARTPSVIATVQALLPKNFPAAVAESIFNGLQKSAHQLARMAR
jgi:serine/threonine-protein kinase HipA